VFDLALGVCLGLGCYFVKKSPETFLTHCPNRLAAMPMLPAISSDSISSSLINSGATRFLIFLIADKSTWQNLVNNHWFGRFQELPWQKQATKSTNVMSNTGCMYL